MIKISARVEICFKVFAPSAPLFNAAMTSALTISCQRGDERARERASHPLSCHAEAKKMKSLALLTCGCHNGLLFSSS